MQFYSFEEFVEQFDDFIHPNDDVFDIDEIYVNGETSFCFFDVNDTGLMGAIISVVDIAGEPLSFCMTLEDLQRFNSNIEEIIEGLQEMESEDKIEDEEE